MSWESALGALTAVCLATFGREVLYRPGTGVPCTVIGVVETGARLEETVPGTYAMMFLRLADLPQAPECGDEVEIDGTGYKVFEVEADAAGGLKLTLRIR